MLSPRENQNLFGHAQEKNLFLNAFHSSRFPHAWICAGNFGIGKATFAFHMARYILSGRTNRETYFPKEDLLYRRIVAQSEEGVWCIGEEAGSEIGIESIRALNKELQQTSREDTWRVIILDGVEKLNRNASNALLKNLEEPPKKTVFFLLTSRPGCLLPTIRSRCQVLVFSPLTLHDMEKVLIDQGMSLPENASFAEGSPGRFLRLREEKELISKIEDILKGNSPLPFIQMYSENQESYALTEDFLRGILHTRLLSALDDKTSTTKFLSIYDKVICFFDQCRYADLDRSATLACVFHELKK